MNAQVDGTGAATVDPPEVDAVEAPAEEAGGAEPGQRATAGDHDPVSRESEPQIVVQGAPTPPPVAQRVDFGAHLEANYQRLVAQLYAITLDPGEAHDAVQDAYSRAWRRWPEIVSATDPTDWVRRVAVRTTQRSWRRVLGRFGLTRPRPVGDADPRTSALLAALGRLPAAERRAVVLHHMVGMGHAEIATLEQTGADTVRDRLARAQLVVTEGMADELPSVLGLPPGPDADHYDRHPFAGDPYAAAPYGSDPYEGDRYGSDRYRDDPYGHDPYGGARYGGDSRTHDDRHADERLR